MQDEPAWDTVAAEDMPETSPVITVPADAVWQFTIGQVWSQGPKPVSIEESWTHPLPSARLLSQFGNRGIIPGVTSSAFHNGIDLAATLGTQILAAGSGVVIYAGHGNKTLGLSGWVVVIQHLDGTSTAYNHMSESGVLVAVGDDVTTGDVIALVGSEGRSTGPHLHFSAWVDGRAVNPVNYLQERGVSVPGGRASTDESTQGDPNDPHQWDWTGAEQGDGPPIEEPYGDPEPDPVEQTPSDPEPEPTPAPEPEPTPAPEPEPTPEPSTEPTPTPSVEPEPTEEPTQDPTEEPSDPDPTDGPSDDPEPTPTDEPTGTPTAPGSPSEPEHTSEPEPGPTSTATDEPTD
ncbi:peptidoglycan DD-metalloendopeptidase family protein [Pseudactinotalea terrae]|uniref:peptidoglycan DD-metalloendopeptidase family protein n=1 Tax=Pseudactinotalea terrae TaxID=1743262 RepID=UPI0013913C7C|nr:peptidoglycan DD-metalloendopeptidase family protein [Pseudactinotalea terrae]